MNKEIYTGFKDYNYREIIDKGNYKGFNYYIISMGTQPCSYVEIPKEHKLYNVHYINLSSEVNSLAHGGITFTEDHLLGISENEHKWFIGWDYAHYGDYIYFGEKLVVEGHKYTLKELKEDVFKFIDEIKEMKEESDSNE